MASTDGYQWVQHDSLQWINRPGSDDYLAYSGHEPAVTQRIMQEKGHIFLDIGAHVGRYTVRCAKNFDIVYAWEPGYSQQVGLLTNIQMNDIHNVVIAPFAAWCVATPLWFGTREREAQSTVMDHRYGGTPVLAYPPDSLVPTPDVVKVDVEGADYEVLVGMSKMLEHHPVIYLEVHDWVDSELPHKCRTLLEEYNYTIEQLPVNGEMFWRCHGV